MSSSASAPLERATIGVHRVAITILRKSEGDLLVSQHSMERWFVNEEAAVRALQSVARVFSESERMTDRRERAQDELQRQDSSAASAAGETAPRTDLPTDNTRTVAESSAAAGYAEGGEANA